MRYCSGIPRGEEKVRNEEWDGMGFGTLTD